VSGGLRQRYATEAVPALQKQFNYINRMQIRACPRSFVNIGLGEALTNPKAVDAAVGDLAGRSPASIR